MGWINAIFGPLWAFLAGPLQQVFFWHGPFRTMGAMSLHAIRVSSGTSIGFLSKRGGKCSASGHSMHTGAHIGFMYKEPWYVYPSRLGPWATFGGLERIVVGRVHDIFSGYRSFCVSWEVISNFMPYLHSLTKQNFRGPFGPSGGPLWPWKSSGSIPYSAPLYVVVTIIYIASFLCNFATWQDLSYALIWVATLTFL